MMALLRALYASPEAERDPEAWATRFAAHFGLGCLGWLLLVRFTGPQSAAVAVCLAYLAWEALQWPGGLRMAADGVLDWCAVTLGVCALAAVWMHDAPAALGFGLATIVVALAGIERRTKWQ